MNKIILTSVFLFFLACNNQKIQPNSNDIIVFGEQIKDESHHKEIHENLDLASKESNKNDSILVSLYSLSEKNPTLAIKKADSVIQNAKKETDKIKLMVRNSLLSSFSYFMAETKYRIGDYKSSLEILEKEDDFSDDNAAALAANYIKLGKPEKAKPLIDSIRNYLTDYARANYYECVGDKKQAFKIYEKIKNDKSIKHYAYYQLAANRYNELSKPNPKLLNEIYFPTGNPNFDIADSDDVNRSKIFDLFLNMPEVNKCKCGVYIVESPQENEKDYYWIKIGNIESDNISDIGNLEKLTTKYDFYIYPKNNFDIKFYNPKTKQTMSLEEWRSNR
ncbi:hypothetical protein GCM10010992_01660 [Cloacibacterium rupense]|uniref:Tetratricopeptide repeat-containing protein n=1 Tax=Cloacibacterium rupense TaxID=517423 RepID=A0ABQ2NGY8_9FLAO|nr:hypothetical protein [Cloacibacterium rupense]GGP01408.1 hypothetical protein GCM10010992_01660 [Cloacibacterium rupense]